MNETLTKNSLKKMSSSDLAQHMELCVWATLVSESEESSIVEEVINRLRKEPDNATTSGLLICNDSDCEIRHHCDHAIPHLENKECKFICEAELPCAVCQPMEVCHD